MTKPAHNESFGFSIKGGKEHGSPIFVEYVTAGNIFQMCCAATDVNEVLCNVSFVMLKDSD